MTASSTDGTVESVFAPPRERHIWPEDVSLDGRWLLFTSENPAAREPFPDASHLFLMDLHDPQTARQLTSPETYAEYGNARFSPDGEKVLYIAGDSSGRGLGGQLWMAERDGSDRFRVDHESRRLRKVTAATWSPDGEKMMYAVGTYSTDFEPLRSTFYLAGAEGSNPRPAFSVPGYVDTLTWRR